MAGICPQRESDRKQARPAPSPSQAIFLCTLNPFQSLWPAPEPRLGLDKVVQAPLCKHALPTLPLWTSGTEPQPSGRGKGQPTLFYSQDQGDLGCPTQPSPPFPPNQLGRSFSPKSIAHSQIPWGRDRSHSPLSTSSPKARTAKAKTP